MNDRHGPGVTSCQRALTYIGSALESPLPLAWVFRYSASVERRLGKVNQTHAPQVLVACNSASITASLSAFLTFWRLLPMAEVDTFKYWRKKSRRREGLR